MSGAVADPKLPLHLLLPWVLQALPPWLPLVSSQSSQTATGPTSGLIVAGEPLVSQTLLLVPDGTARERHRIGVAADPRGQLRSRPRSQLAAGPEVDLGVDADRAGGGVVVEVGVRAGAGSQVDVARQRGVRLGAGAGHRIAAREQDPVRGAGVVALDQGLAAGGRGGASEGHPDADPVAVDRQRERVGGVVPDGEPVLRAVAGDLAATQHLPPSPRR